MRLRDRVSIVRRSLSQAVSRFGAVLLLVLSTAVLLIPGLVISFAYVAPATAPAVSHPTRFLFLFTLDDTARVVEPEILVRNDGFVDLERVSAIVSNSAEGIGVSVVDVFYNSAGLGDRVWKCGPSASSLGRQSPVAELVEIDDSQRERLDSFGEKISSFPELNVPDPWISAVSFSASDVGGDVLNGAFCAAEGDSAPSVGGAQRYFLGTNTYASLTSQQQFKAWGWADFYFPGAWEPRPFTRLNADDDSGLNVTWIEYEDRVNVNDAFRVTSGSFSIRDLDEERKADVAAWGGALLIGTWLGIVGGFAQHLLLKRSAREEDRKMSEHRDELKAMFELGVETGKSSRPRWLRWWSG